MPPQCAVRACGRICLAGRKLCGVHAEELDMASVTVWNGGELLPPYSVLSGGSMHGAVIPDTANASMFDGVWNVKIKGR